MLSDIINTYGALAQLGAHNTGSVGVRGSNPLCSTKKNRSRTRLRFFSYDCLRQIISDEMLCIVMIGCAKFADT